MQKRFPAWPLQPLSPSAGLRQRPCSAADQDLAAQIGGGQFAHGVVSRVLPLERPIFGFQMLRNFGFSIHCSKSGNVSCDYGSEVERA